MSTNQETLLRARYMSWKTRPIGIAAFQEIFLLTNVAFGKREKSISASRGLWSTSMLSRSGRVLLDFVMPTKNSRRAWSLKPRTGVNPFGVEDFASAAPALT